MIDDFTRRERRRYLGSSDAAAILGLDAWGRTAGDVYAAKTGRVPDGATSKAMELGNYLEPAVLAWTEAQLESPIQRDVFLVHPNEILCANLDGVALHAPEPVLVEAKAVGLLGRPKYVDDFGEPGTDEIPAHIIVQVHHQFVVWNAQDADHPLIHTAVVPALIGGRGFVLYRVERNASLCEALFEDMVRFWQDHVLADVPPPEAPSLETLKRLKRVDEAVPVRASLVQCWLDAREATQASKMSENNALAAVLVELGGATAGNCELGQFTYRQQFRKGYEVKESTFRVPRFTKAKEAR